MAHVQSGRRRNLLGPRRFYPCELFAILQQADATGEVLADMATCITYGILWRGFIVSRSPFWNGSWTPLAELAALSMVQLVYGNTSLIEEGHVGHQQDAGQPGEGSRHTS